MNGMDLYEAMDLIEGKYLMEALEEDSRELHKKNRKGKQSQRIRIKTWGKIIGSMAAAFILVFTGIVNLFPTVAFAMNDVILLGDLAKAVTFDPSMKACLENEYAQYVGEKQLTEEGYGSEVYCMVVDASRVSIFYKTDVPNISMKDGDVYSYPDIKEADVEGSAHATSIIETEIEGLYEYRIDFDDGEIPEQIQFEIHYVKNAVVDVEDENTLSKTDETISKSVYQLYPEEKYRKVIKTYDINQNVEINGQSIKVEKLDIYPTQAKLWFQEDKDNSAILLDMDIVLKDDKGREYGAKTNGWTGSSNERGSVITKFYQSTYFSKTEEITIEIKSAEWISNEKRCGMISYENQTIENLPEGVKLNEMRLNADESLTVELCVPIENDTLKQLGDVRCIETGEYCEYVEDEEGRAGYSTMIYDENPEYQIQRFTFANYRENAYEMVWDWGTKEELETPIEILVK